ncbi:uncharacterized protein BDV17DRAFT_128297 [Aspergillus undulatus]|uniref:uncharacterized protein n=1 Tax=Aspergillus undulatus TaxID=1810928 RepID=UPI003CCCF778
MMLRHTWMSRPRSLSSPTPQLVRNIEIILSLLDHLVTARMRRLELAMPIVILAVPFSLFTHQAHPEKLAFTFAPPNVVSPSRMELRWSRGQLSMFSLKARSIGDSSTVAVTVMVADGADPVHRKF